MIISLFLLKVSGSSVDQIVSVNIRKNNTRNPFDFINELEVTDLVNQ